MPLIVGTNEGETLDGTSDADTIRGLGGNDHIDGREGADQLEGGTGDDVFVVDNVMDVIVELDGEGFDTVLLDAAALFLKTYVLAAEAHAEWLSTTWTAGQMPVDITGNAFDQYLLGNNGSNALNGMGGADVMIGYGGSDKYYVDNAGDQMFEATNAGGTDIAYISVDYTLAAGVEMEILQSNIATPNNGAGLKLTGNEIFNWLAGTNGKDVLDGGAGADRMTGADGDDIYIVDHAGDVVDELLGGFDVLYTSTSYSIDEVYRVDWLSTSRTAGTDAIDIIVRSNGTAQQALNQYLLGNNGTNTLDGGRGNDVMIGFGGDDVYVVGSVGDTVYENAGEGFDTILTQVSYTLAAGLSVEWLSAFSTAGFTVLDLTGNEFAQHLLGTSSANVLNGMGGADTLLGFGGADTFAFTTALGGGNVDLIADFLGGTDKIALDDAIFAGIGGPGAFNADAFVTGSAAADANDRIIYNSGTGQLFYDADGTGAGAAVLFATLQGNPVLAASDFTVI